MVLTSQVRDDLSLQLVYYLDVGFKHHMTEHYHCSSPNFFIEGKKIQNCGSHILY
jgi:hypothetical protein